ncbi:MULTISPECIES: SGNH/GDSL hydrolase family protein [Streptomyces]|uniref:Lipolytic enzyme n=1 Tax=Streptomyces albus (strain ATCC 21838 / DSM 41398 / FERM P-419 / JCM 4703 / NBRC 107858) TaxID=1081613 RepID=A0A0B5EUA6_STRA4|nr:SGNH/GDSL hydrolase family protein [Streptomyces sp. SCSIO ZS0520]AJE85304.1 lipolytic enzyme [Streptomyces albus]AOU79611.1 lipolytic enzyme [Streptomyces albus]AYN35334.1 lipolytic enzyme [Streptomyces albus]
MNARSADEQYDPYCIAPEMATELLAQAPWRRFVVLGDAFAEGPGEPCEGYDDVPWAHGVAAALRSVHPDLAYLNLAQRDPIAAEVRARQLGKALTFQPDLAAVAAGGSDVLRDSFDADATEAELARIIAPLRDAGVEVVVLAPFGRGSAGQIPKDVLRRRLRLLSERTYDLALRNGAIHVDLGAHPASAEPGIFGADGRHVNARGHAIAAAATIRRLGVHLGVYGPPSLR